MGPTVNICRLLLRVDPSSGLVGVIQKVKLWHLNDMDENNTASRSGSDSSHKLATQWALNFLAPFHRSPWVDGPILGTGGIFQSVQLHTYLRLANCLTVLDYGSSPHEITHIHWHPLHRGIQMTGRLSVRWSERKQRWLCPAKLIRLAIS